MALSDGYGTTRLRARFLSALGVAGLAASACDRSSDKSVPVNPTPLVVTSPTSSAAPSIPPNDPADASSSALATSVSDASVEAGPTAADIIPTNGKVLAKTIVVGREVCVPAAGTEGIRSPEAPGCGNHPGSQGFRAEGQALPCGPCAFSLNVEATNKQRKKFGNACCYTGSSPHGPGRVLRTAAGVLPAPSHRADWLSSLPLEPLALVADETREAAHRAWLEAAALEHASVATFARLSLELLALGAPPELVEGAHAAALDEIRHAKDSYAIAAAYGERVGPAPLRAAAAPFETPTLERIACEALTDGCFGETFAALLAQRGAETALSPHVRAVLVGITEDESRHAELAFRTVAWAVRSGGAPVANALRAALSAIDITPESSVDDVDLSTHGFVSREERNALRIAVLNEIVKPCLRSLLGQLVDTPSVLAST